MRIGADEQSSWAAVVQWSESVLTHEQAWYMTSSVFVALLSEQVLHVVFLAVQNCRNQEADCNLLLKTSRLGMAISSVFVPGRMLPLFVGVPGHNTTLVCGSSWPQ